MNLFFLHLDPQRSANYYCNRHCIKIILEITQMLYCAHWLAPNTPTGWITDHELCLDLKPYRKTHYNHPTSKWIRQHINNYKYACSMALALCIEYTARYNKIHQCQQRIEWLQEHIPRIDESIDIPNSYLATTNIPPGCTPVPLAMPEQYHSSDLLQSYRTYYIFGKAHLADSDEQWAWLRSEFNL
jgi:hypothetical protein